MTNRGLRLAMGTFGKGRTPTGVGTGKRPTPPTGKKPVRKRMPGKVGAPLSKRKLAGGKKNHPVKKATPPRLGRY